MGWGDAAAVEIEPHGTDARNRIKKAFKLLRHAESDAAGKFQGLPVGEDVKFMRADTGIAADDFVNAGQLPRAYGREIIGKHQQSAHGQHLRDPAPKILAALPAADRPAPDSD